MSKGRYCKLIMVTGENNNKYYELIDNGSTITVNYGRVESTKVTITKPISQWDSIIRSKVAKGYKDVTDLITVEVKKDTKEEVKIQDILDSKVNSFLNLMKKYTDGLVSTTYSVKATNVTKKQIDQAQEYINDLNKEVKTTPIPQQKVNDLLISLYTIIPRQMKNVKDHLLPSIKVDKTLQQEQDNLDAMASQVNMLQPTTKEQKKDKKKAQTLLDVLEISMKEIKPTKEIEYLVNQCTGKKIDGIFELKKDKEDKKFDSWMKGQKNKQTRILIHGTRCSSFLPIIEQGLKIRPQGNFQFSGKAYGDGNYFSETVVKSLGYTGYDNDMILIVYEVHVGNPFVYNGWFRGNSFPLTYKNLQERGFDSTFVSAGNGLLNSEVIAYKEEQCRPKYLIHLKR